VPLPPGASLIQTGGTTAVGRLVIQAARARGVRTISIIRDRPDGAALDAAKAALTALGADCVLSEAEAGVRGGRAGRPAGPLPPPGIPPPCLGLDCVGGGAGMAAARALAPGGTLVVYGGLGRAPLALPAGPLIFNDLRVRGFWLSGPAASTSAAGPAARAARGATLARAVDLLQRGVLGTPVERVPLERWGDALAALRAGGRAKKQVLVLP
jgi:trans-2-enoyl-CoA reductase